VTEEEQAAVRRAAVASTLRFVDTFPHHEHAAVVLGAAVDDLFEMKEFEQAIAIGRRLIEIFPDADPAIRRSAWTVVGHASFELSDYEAAEGAYARVLETTPAGEESHQALTDNLAAAIYKQGEQAGQRDDHRLAADHFLRIARVAPGSEIRPAAEYDAGAALIRLEDWVGAASVLEAFRRDHPDHPLREEATKQIALVYRKGGELARAAREYERVASEADEDELRREALLLAGELYEDARLADRALEVYLGYVRRFPRPLELAVETHFKIAALHGAAQDRAAQHEQLRKVVEIDAAAGAERTDRIRVLAARSALALSEELYGRFGEVRLVQPFESNLREKQRRMDAALAAFRGLVDYQVGDVTAAATFYMAQLYSDFSRALLESERPIDLDAAELQDYELALEEESFPFEERAIEVHEKNLELMAADVYNPWIEKSLRELAELMPGRYAKFEESSGFIASIDRYAYRLPSAAAPATDESGSDATPESDELSVRSDPGAAPGSQDLADGSAVVSR
jgi:TolA-binding protein